MVVVAGAPQGAPDWTLLLLLLLLLLLVNRLLLSLLRPVRTGPRPTRVAVARNHQDGKDDGDDGRNDRRPVRIRTFADDHCSSQTESMTVAAVLAVENLAWLGALVVVW